MIVSPMLLASDSEEEPHCSPVTCEAAAKIPNLHTSFPTVFIHILKKRKKRNTMDLHHSLKVQSPGERITLGTERTTHFLMNQTLKQN